MRHHRVISILVVVLALLLGQAAVLARPVIDYEDVPTAFVVDPCRVYDDYPGWPQTSELRMIDLTDSEPLEIDWEHSTDLFGGVAFTSVPDYEKAFVFATVGSKLVVYDVLHRWWPEDPPVDPPDEPVGRDINLVAVHEVDLGTELNLPGLELGRIVAGGWYGIEVEPGALIPQAALYIVGTRPDNDEAFYIVVDQESLILGDPVTVYGHGQLCYSGNCTVSSVLDIRVGDLGGPDYVEEAYITTVQPFSVSTELQMTYRLERFVSGSAFSSQAVHASYFEAPQAGVDPPLVEEASGLRFAPDSHDAYVPRKDNWRIENLVSRAESCALPAEPTDVAVWQPASSAVRYLFVTTYDGLTGRLYVTPADSCVDPQNPFVLDIAIANRPVSLDLLTAGDDDALVVVVGEGAKEFQSFDLTYTGSTEPFVYSYGGLELGTTSIETSCPSYVHLGLRDVVEMEECAPKNCPGKDRNCLPGDLRCNIEPQPPHGDDEGAGGGEDPPPEGDY